ncbi:ATP-dependent endonuclease [Cobetia sp. QF-1]|uniref:ATP-dependent nuclease n=1 Tax=Cobetia sp. QF-1 TaxID=1969833 RepID=UPI000B53EFE8|nr:AAA family ATPase [Cobetia sp. QF-1]
MLFNIIDGPWNLPPESGVYLIKDNWNDYSFITMFDAVLVDLAGEYHNLGRVKIGFEGQVEEISTYSVIPKKFEQLDSNFFSLGESVDFYKKLSTLEVYCSNEILVGLRDVVYDPLILDRVRDEEVFGVSLLRNVSISLVKGQFRRVLNGLAEVTNYNFKFIRPVKDDFGGLELEFDVIANSLPATNIHALIGRNGVGKTTVLNSMINSIVAPDQTESRFYEVDFFCDEEISRDYFSSIVSVSFSAFDPFAITENQEDSSKGARYFYIGLKDPNDRGANSRVECLFESCTRSLIECFREKKKTSRWLHAINKLRYDEIFNGLRLESLEEKFRDVLESFRSSDMDISECPDDAKFILKYYNEVSPILNSMSSGHAITFLTITHLVATVEEKTLILVDEPEAHLHPPLLSSFIRALSDLLYDRNGVAIIATHSPVVLQEIPRSCVSKIYRIGSDVRVKRPDLETFAENVGILTREVFGLEATSSGFHEILKREVDKNKTYNEILHDFKHQLGLEGRAILKGLISNHDRGDGA